jgi:hypothetical protein
MKILALKAQLEDYMTRERFQELLDEVRQDEALKALFINTNFSADVQEILAQHLRDTRQSYNKNELAKLLYQIANQTASV